MSKANELILYGTVGFDWWDDEYFTAKQVRERLAQMSGDITVRINSGGGVASEGQAIYTMLVDYPGKVTVIVDGVAASAASLISMAGDEIVYRLGAWTLIHDPATPWTLGRGTEEDHLKEAELLGVISNAYADIYAARSGLSREECRAIMKAETVLDGAMAVEMGFANSVDSGAQAIPEAAFDYRIYAHAPDHLRKASRKLGRAPAEEAVMAMIAGRPRPTAQQKEPTMAGKTQTAAGATLAANTGDEIEVTVETRVDDPQTPVVEITTPTAEAAAAAATLRARRILAATMQAGLPDTFADELIASKKSVEACIDDITAKWREQGDMDTAMQGRPTARILRDERETMRAGMSQAIEAQLARKAPESDKARPFMDLSLVEMAAEAIGHKGRTRTSQDKLDVFMSAMHTTSDFPSVFENALNKRLLAGYALATPVYSQISMRADFTDFRPHPMVNTGSMPLLQPVNEKGEIKYGTIGDKKETVTLAALAIAIGFTRQMIVNDDLAAIDRMLTTQGAAVARTEEKVFFDMMLTASGAGPTLTETGRAVFNTTDTTLAASGAAITVDSLAAGRAAIQKHKGINGEDLALNPAILLVGPDKLTQAQQMVETIGANDSAKVNPFSGRLTVISTPKITGNAWYLLPDPGVQALFMHGFLQGDDGPRLRMEEPFGSQGVRYSIERDFGVGAIDWRGGWRNPGA